jgi:tetratricopeptide (TPR) repeat protein
VTEQIPTSKRRSLGGQIAGSVGTTTVLPLLICLLCCGSGCNALRQRRVQQVAHSTARQFSLRGFDALQAQKYDDAEALFSESLRHSPNDERAHWGLAEVLYQRGDRQTAAKHMQEAAKVSGNNPEMSVRLGQMHIDAGRVVEAIQQADLALSIDWQHAGAWELKGRALERAGKNREAMEAYHRALMSQPNNALVQLALAALYQREGKPQRALATLERLSDSQNNQYCCASAYLIKGAALASLGQTEESRACLVEAGQLTDAQDPHSFIQLAQLQAQNGDLADARSCLGRALNLQPDNPAALQLQSELDQKFGDPLGPIDTIATPGKSNINTVAGPSKRQPIPMPPAKTGSKSRNSP